MAENANRTLNYLVAAVVALLLAGCANQLPPGGGEVDNIPPEIIELYPSDGTTNFTDDYIELGFSEYVDKRSVRDAIFISPAIDGQLELDWSGKYVRINFPSTLKENTTYVVTVGTDLVDYNNKNRMAAALNLAFSTGPKIDRRVVSGKIFEQKPEGVLIYAYKLDKNNPGDTLLQRKPDYVSQTGKDGSYKLGGLAAGSYRIFAVKDEYRDMLFQSEQDKIGVPFNEVSLSETDTLFSGLNFFLSSADTIPPRILNAVMTDRYHILVTTGEEFDSTYIRADNFFLYDSTSLVKKNLKYAFKSSKPAEFVLVIKDSVSVENLVYLFSDSLSDKAGNVFRSDYTPIITTDKPDTSAPSVAETIPSANYDKVDFQNASFQFLFNDAFDTSLVKNGISFADTSDHKLSFNLNFLDDASFLLFPSAKLEPKKDYSIKIDFNKFTDAAGNKLDSIYIYNFKTITGLDFTGASGVISGIELNRNPLLVLQSTGEEKKTYQQRAGTGGTFNFQRVQPGKYILWAFTDEDSSNTYTKGWPYPYKPSEEFSFYPDTLNLRARWSQSDINFKFK